METIPILRIVGSLNALGNTQMGVEDTADVTVGYKQWGGKDDEGNVTTFIGRNRFAQLLQLQITGTEVTGPGAGFLKHTATGLVYGGPLTGGDIPVHNSLTGLNDGDYQHLTASEKAGVLNKSNVCSSSAEMQALIDAGWEEVFTSADSNFSGTITIPYGVEFRIIAAFERGMHLDGDLTITLGAGSGYVGSIKIDSIDLADNTLTFGGGAGTIGPHIEIYNLNSTISPATSLIKTTDVGAASINIGKIDDSSITFQDFNFVKYEEGNEVLGINNTSLTRVFWRTPTTLNNVCSSIDEMQTLIDAGFKEIYIQPGSTYSGEVVIPYGTNFRIKSIVNDGLALSGDFRLLMGTGTGYSGSITIESLDLDGYTFGLSSVTGGYGPDAEIYTVKGGGTIETDSYVSSPAGVYIGKVLGSAITSQNINMMYEEAENPIVKIGVDALEQVFWRTPQGGGGMLQDLSQVLMEGNDAGGQDIVNAGAISVGLSVPDASMSIVTQSGSVRNVWGYTHDYVSGLTGTRYQSEFGASSGNTYFGISSFIDGGSNYGDMVFNTGGGNVGIGKTPSDKFDVNGVILSQATNTNIDSAGVKAVPTTEWVKAQYDHAHPFGRAGSNSMPNNTDVDLPFIWYDENIAGSWGWDGQGPNPDRTLDAVADGIIIGFSVKASTLDSDVTFGFKINGVKDATTWTLTSATKKLVQLGTNVAFTAGDTVIPYLIKTTGVWVGTEIAAEVYTQGNSY